MLSQPLGGNVARTHGSLFRLMHPELLEGKPEKDAWGAPLCSFDVVLDARAIACAMIQRVKMPQFAAAALCLAVNAIISTSFQAPLELAAFGLESKPLLHAKSTSAVLAAVFDVRVSFADALNARAVTDMASSVDVLPLELRSEFADFLCERVLDQPVSKQSNVYLQFEGSHRFVPASLMGDSNLAQRIVEAARVANVDLHTVRFCKIQNC
jgi:hypothetical protein